MKIKRLTILLVALLVLPGLASADQVGNQHSFFVDEGHDVQSREQVKAELKATSSHAYFYIEQGWYDDLEQSKKEQVKQNLKQLGQEFDTKIYPELTKTYGSEWKPGIDDDSKITVLFHSLKQNSGGYFRSNDEYEKLRVPNSNEREMIYVNTKHLTGDVLNSYVAHEFTHLITFNQKNKLRDVQEEIWLNELRANYSPIMLGYAKDYQNSILRQRVKEFINHPSDSLTGWEHQEKDYGALTFFAQYLVQHYDLKLLVDSLQSREVGIASINKALQENGYQVDFSEIFTDWSIAAYINDCEVNSRYCYWDKNLKDVKVTPSFIFVPSTQKTELSLNYSLEPWSARWYKFAGNADQVTIKVDGADSVDFKVPYVNCDNNNDCSVKTLNLNEQQQASTTFEEFSSSKSSLALIPSVQSIKSGFNGTQPSYSFSISVSTQKKEDKQRTKELRRKVAELQARVDELLTRLKQQQQQQKYACSQINRDLNVGMKSKQVKCLQQFLKAQDNVYPEGLVTGYFGPLTKAAVIRFQERYQSEILAPWSLQKGTGYVGRTTKQQINKMIQ